VDVSGPNGWTATCDAVADATGAWSCQVTLSDGEDAAGVYTYTATGLVSGVNESGTFTDGGLRLRAMAGATERAAQLLDAFRNPKAAHAVSAAE